jgi:hypothetical protein
LSRSFQTINAFKVDFNISWDSEFGTSATARRAVQALFIRLFDDSRNAIAFAGYQDAYLMFSGQKVAFAGNQNIVTGPNSLPFFGSAAIQIERDQDNAITVSWDDSLLLSSSDSKPLGEVEIEFRYCDDQQDLSHFGTESVGLVRIAGDVINLAPVADAGGDQSVEVGAEVMLDGSDSFDPDGNDPITYMWEITEKPLASTAELDDPNSVQPRFTADLPGVYIVKLMVTDSLGLPSDDSFATISAGDNMQPVAIAGEDQTVLQGSLVTLDGSGSFDPDSNDPLTFEWDLTNKPLGSTAVLNDPNSAQPSFTADLAGQYEVKLTVNDGLLDSADTPESKITITAISPQIELSLFPSQTNLRRGQNLDYWVGITNDADARVCFEYFTVVTLPNGKIFPSSGAFFGPFDVCLGPSESIWEFITHFIPFDAAFGLHNYSAAVGNLATVTLWDIAFFDFRINQF